METTPFNCSAKNVCVRACVCMLVRACVCVGVCVHVRSRMLVDFYSSI